MADSLLVLGTLLHSPREVQVPKSRLVLSYRIDDVVPHDRLLLLLPLAEVLGQGVQHMLLEEVDDVRID